jgi:PAS domain S-box-containing protein
MSLRIKALLTIGAVTLSLVLALSSIAALLLPPNFAALERQHVQHDLDQVAAMLENEAAALAVTAQDWAAWDDTYQFVEDRNQAYVEANLPDWTLTNLQLNLMVFVDRSGQIVFGKQLDRDSRPLPLPEGIAPYLRSPGPFLPGEAAPRPRHGLVALPEGILLAAVHPILRSDGQSGPARGVLVLGRWLDDAELARLARLTQHPFRLVSLDGPLPADMQAPSARLTPDQPLLTLPRGDELVAGYRLLFDITGAPQVAAIVEQGRPIVQQGQAALYTLIFTLTIAGLIFGLTALLVMELMVLRPLARVEAAVRQVRAEPDQVARIHVGGRDELTSLANAFNETVNDLRTTQRQLQASEARYRAVVEDQTEFICRWRPDATLTFANSAYRQAFAALQPPERHLVPAAVVDEDRQLADAHLAQLSSWPAGATLEVRVALPDGRVRWQQWVDRPIVDEGGRLVEIQSVGRDITEHKRAEEEQRRLERRLMEAQRLESLGTLASGAAHDFNNLLSIILGSSGLVLNELSAASPLGPTVERIEYAARRAADLTEQLLAYGGRGRISVQPLDLNVLIADLQPLLAASVAKSSTLIYDLAPGRLPIVADGGQIRQMAMNLVINAAEAIGYGEGEITVATSAQEIDRATLDTSLLGSQRAPGSYVCLDVRDTGVGIEPATLPHIFDPFFSTKLGGHGLGLAAVLGVVRAHEGAITVTSVAGAGAWFRVLIPLTERRLPVEWVASAGAEPWHGQGKILVIDPEPVVGETTAGMLRQLGFTPRLAHDGETGLRLFRDDPFGIACVLLDLTSPYRGADLLASLRVHRPDVPVVVMSAFDRPTVLGAIGAEVAAVLSKPFDARALRALLQKVLGGV